MRVLIIRAFLCLSLVTGFAAVGIGTTPAQAAVCFTFNRTLKEGMSGEDVRVLQVRVAGYPGYGSSIAADGQFGPATKAAVTRFQ